MPKYGYQRLNFVEEIAVGGMWMLFYPEEQGQGLIEYALIITLVTLIVIIMVSLLGPAIRNAYSNIIEGL